MAYIIGISTAVLALAIWQEKVGSDHIEADLGSDRGPGSGEH